MRPGAEANYLEVDPKPAGAERRLGLLSGQSAWAGAALRTDDGLVLTENAAILQYVSRSFSAGRHRNRPAWSQPAASMLCFIGTELHKGLFVPILDKKAPPEMKTYVLGKGLSRLDYLENYLQGREFLSTISASPRYLRHQS